MKKVLFVMTILVSVFFAMPSMAESNVSLTQGNVGLVLGGGQGGAGTDEINTFQYFYGGVYGEYPITEWLNVRGTVNYFANAEEGDAWYSSSTSGLSSRVETIRMLAGISMHGEVEGWWIYDNIQAGVDYEIGEGVLPVTVIQNELLFGKDWFYNFLTMSARFGEEDYESYYLRDQAFIRLTDWFAVGPQTEYVWFYQYDEDGDSHLEYEPAFGGQVRFSPNDPDPQWHITVGATHGDFVGTKWGADFWIRFP